MLAKHRLLSELLRVVLPDAFQLIWVRHRCLVDHRLYIIFQLLHNVFVLELSDVHLFALYVCIKEGALLS